MKKQPCIALYGNVAIEKAYCEECQELSFVIDGELRCCGTRPSGAPTRYKRESIPAQRRKLPSMAARRQKMIEQEFRCFYCDLAFGEIVHKRKRNMILRVEWDHQVPYAYSQNNKDDNFVAACQICNRIKKDFCFDTIEEAKSYVSEKRAEKGYVLGMREEVSEEPPLAKILSQGMPVAKLEQEKTKQTNRRRSSSRKNSEMVRRRGNSIRSSNKNKENRINYPLPNSWLQVKTETKCPECGKEVKKNRPWQKFCSDICRWRNWDKKHPRIKPE